MTNVFLDPATMTATYNLPTRHSSIATNEVYTFKSKESRDSTALYLTKTLAVSYGACQVSSLSSGKVTFSNGTSFGMSLYYQGSGVKSFTFTYSIPMCNGFQPALT
jgi:hypothetical protein